MIVQKPLASAASQRAGSLHQPERHRQQEAEDEVKSEDEDHSP